MGRKARANKGKVMKSKSFPDSLPQVKVVADEIHHNTSPDPPRSETLPSSGKKSKTQSSIVRRSQRILNTGIPKLVTEHVVQEIYTSESDKEVEPLLNENRNASSQETSNEAERSAQKDSLNVAEIYKKMYIKSQKKIENLEAENRHLSKNFENALGKVDEVSERSAWKDNPNLSEVDKNMNINSQKIDDLAAENKHLSKNLEHALGKVDAYEKQSHIYSEAMAVIASLSKANENLSTLCATSEDGKTKGKVFRKRRRA